MAAALRELREETGIDLPADLLGPPIRLSFRHEQRPIISTVYPIHVDQPLEPVIDHAEIVWAGFVRLEELSSKKLAPGLVAYLEKLDIIP